MLTRLQDLVRQFHLARRLSQHPQLCRLVVESLNAEDQAEADLQYNEKFHILDELSSVWGFEIYNHHSSWMTDTAFWKLWKDFPLAGQRPDRKFVLWSLTNSLQNIPGDTVECGVLYGHSSHVICSAMHEGHQRVHHAFDSFEGLSEPTAEDAVQTARAYSWKKGDLSVSLDEVQRNLKTFERIEYYQGWIPERFSEVSERTFAFVHVDVDLFQPTYDSLEFFCERLVPGGIVVCDDYGFNTCPGARRAVDMVSENTGFPVIHLPTGQGVMIRPHA
ncbi:MAG: TylF/MycF family methyltransferase [Fuerstiella sp.]|nr:TylF/MycF family methyltransferase [Fuerstiella sp.]